MNGLGHAEWEELASLDALGLLEGEEEQRWLAHLTECHSCQREASDMAEVVAAIAATGPRATPPPSLRGKVLSQVGVEGAASRKIIRATDRDWQPTPFPGVEYRLLSTNEATGDMTSLVRLAPSAHYAPHRHASSEHCYVLEGDLVFDDHTLMAGDYAVSAPGSHHSASTTVGGALLLIVNNIHDELLA